MRELLPVIEKWLKEEKKVAIATVVKVYGSAPRSLGSKMAVNQDGQMAGSVSGGCVEGAVVEEALQVLKTDTARLVVYGITNEQAINVGLACGGTIEVFIERLSEPAFSETRSAIKQNRLGVKITALAGKHLGQSFFAYQDAPLMASFLPPEFDTEVNDLLSSLFQTLKNQRITLPQGDEEVELFCEVITPLAKLIVVGAVHIAIPLVMFARSLGFHTIVIDPRRSFANRERFPHLDELVVDWPEESLEQVGINENSYLVVISHDEKLDVPALAIACRSKARYIGALGSRKTFEKYKQALRGEGITDEELSRIHSPIGIPIGAQGAEEIALSIMAEIIAVRNRVL